VLHWLFLVTTVHEEQFTRPDFATGMMLEVDITEILTRVESKEALDAKVSEALIVPYEFVKEYPLLSDCRLARVVFHVATLKKTCPQRS